MIAIHLIEDHRVVRQGLRRILEDHNDIRVVEESSSAEEALPRIKSSKANLIITDLSLPGRSGIDLIGSLHDMAPQVPVLVLTMLDADLFARQAIKAGASGYLVKSCDPDEMIRAVREIHRGGKYLCTEAAEILVRDLHSKVDTSEPAHQKLSPREFEVMLMTARGHSSHETGKILHLSPSTVDTYKRRVADKCSLKTTRDIPLYAQRHGLID